MGIGRRMGIFNSLYGACCFRNEIESLLQGGNDTGNRFNCATLVNLPDGMAPAFISTPALSANASF